MALKALPRRPETEDPFEMMGDLIAQRSQDAERTSFSEWSMKVPEPKSGKLNFDLFPYQREMYSDEVANAAEVVVQKSTQVGISTLVWRWSAWRADQAADNALYIFPTVTHVKDFGDTRIEPSINASKYLLSRMDAKSVRHKSLKKIGLGFLYLRGSESKAGAQSVDADSIVFDEYDDLDLANLEQLERRLSGAEGAGRTARLRRVGVPRYPEQGINGHYLASDQREWHVTCPKCKKKQTMDFDKNVRWKNPGFRKVMRSGKDEYKNKKDVKEAWRACSECETKLDVAKGEWIALNPGAESIGFNISRLIVPNTNLKEIVRNSRKTKAVQVEAFRQNDLGQPYESGLSSLTRAAIQAAASFGGDSVDIYNGRNYVTAGIDVASTRDLNVRISEHMPDGKKRALYIGLVSDFNELVQMMNRYRVTMAVIDGLPERREAMAFAALFPGRVMVSVYVDNINAEPVQFAANPEDPIIKVNRTEAIDSMMDSIRTLQNFPLKYLPLDYEDHLTNIKRKTEIDDESGKVKRYYVSLGPDDYAHAETYDGVAAHCLAVKLTSGQFQQAAQGTPVQQPVLGLGDLDTGLGSDDYYEGM